MRKVEPPFPVADIFKAAALDLDAEQLLAAQHVLDDAIEPVADDRELQTEFGRGFHEPAKSRIGGHLGDRLFEHRRGGVEQRDLAAHAVLRADRAALPLAFEITPGRGREGFEEIIGHIVGDDRAVEIAQYFPARHQTEPTPTLVFIIPITSSIVAAMRRWSK